MATTAAGIRIQDEEGRVVGHCDGPLHDGSCPMASAEAPRVPCAGRLVRPASSYGRAGWEMRVAPDAAGCPLRTRRVWAKQPGHRWGPTATGA